MRIWTESVVATLFRSESKEERSRSKRSAFVKRQRISTKSLYAKAELAVRGEGMAQQRLYEAEADVEVQHWEKRNTDFAFQEINQEFESQRFQLHQASRWADWAQRDKISLYGEFEIKSRLYRENQAKVCHEIEELRRICCEENRSSKRSKN